jgi:hypothetical protein
VARVINSPKPAAPSRWVNPILGVLGALALSGYLMMGYPSTPKAPSLSDPGLAPAYSQATGSRTHSAAAQDKSTVSSMTDLLKTALGAALALAWAVGGAWLGMRRAQASNRLDGFEAYPTQTAYDSLRAPTCDRMYDETRLVPQYLRRVEFPATKLDLMRLAREHIDEGPTLHRLELHP